MKKNIIFILAICAISLSANAQNFKWGAKVGVGTSSLRPEDLTATKDFKLAITDARFGYYAGLFASFNVGPITLQPEALFNTNRVDYKFMDFKNPTADSIKTEKFNQLDLPLLVGFKVGPLRLKAGPVAHIHINSNSDLKDIKGYEEKWKTALWGYQAGVGLNFSSRVHLDIRYEGNFDKWGSQINIGGTNYAFAQRPSRWLVNMGYAF
jgi:Outer membrane protein beta-barrel domain